MQITYKIFENPQQFVTAARKIYLCERYADFKSSYKIMRMVNALESELKIYMKLRQDVDSKLHKGELKSEDFGAEVEKLHSQEVEIKFGPLTADEVQRIPGLSPADLNVVEMLAEANAFPAPIAPVP